MAVTPTGAIYKSLSFDGESSRNYGVYITGEAVYNAPARDVEMIKIPGRNGEFALDNGRFENIEVSYPAGIFADTEADFRQAISDFRNFLCSRKGYVRLQDEYNPDEYRMAVYKSGLDVDPKLLQAGEFDITFDCKPQRFLTSGETEVAVSSGDTISNPTLFPSNPLLTANGSGTISINDEEIEIYGVYLGNVVLAAQSKTETTNRTVLFANDKYKAGDTISLQGYTTGNNGSYAEIEVTENHGYSSAITPTYSDSNPDFSTIQISGIIGVNRTTDCFRVRFDTLTFTAGTSKTITNVTTLSGQINGRNYSGTVTITITYTPNYSSGYDQLLITITGTQTGVDSINDYMPSRGELSVDSTVPLNDDDVYIDLDIGEAYSIIGGAVVPLNDQIEIPAELPTLNPGTNTITFDNTINTLKITPRWWKV